MQFITGNSRHQTYFSTLEDQVSADNAVRLMDAFINKLDLKQLGLKTTVHKRRPPSPCPRRIFKTVPVSSPTSSNTNFANIPFVRVYPPNERYYQLQGINVEVFYFIHTLFFPHFSSYNFFYLYNKKHQ